MPTLQYTKQKENQMGSYTPSKEYLIIINGKVKLFDVGEREKQNALNEVRIIASIQHPNIVSYKECFLETPNGSNPELCIIMEYADEGDLL